MGILPQKLPKSYVYEYGFFVKSAECMLKVLKKSADRCIWKKI